MVGAAEIPGVDGLESGTCRSTAFEPRRAQRALPPTGVDRTDRAVAEPRLNSVAPMNDGPTRSAGAAATLVAVQPALSAPVRRALVVDDDPEVRRALARFLRPELDVSLAGSVSDAKAVLAQLDRLDVAFVDWELPDGTGEQILEWLSRWPDAIRVLISARFSSSTSPPSSPLPRTDTGDVALAASRTPSAATPSAATPSAATPSAMTPSAMTPSAMTSSAMTPSAMTPSAMTPSERLHAGLSSSTREEIGEKAGERSSEDLMRSNPLKNRALANLVLGKPVAMSVLEALKRAALALPND